MGKGMSRKEKTYNAGVGPHYQDDGVGVGAYS